MNTAFQFTDDKDFTGINFTKKSLPAGEYDHCTFNQCVFTESNLAEYKFINCEFIDCNLSMVILKNTLLQDILFRDCKMLGIRFDQCDDFGLSVTFNNCNLDHAVFYQLNLKRTTFKDSSFREADFTETNLTMAVFAGCDLSGVVFENTILEKADLRTARNYIIDPAKNRLKKVRLSLTGLPGLLDKYDLAIEK